MTISLVDVSSPNKQAESLKGWKPELQNLSGNLS